MSSPNAVAPISTVRARRLIVKAAGTAAFGVLCMAAILIYRERTSNYYPKTQHGLTLVAIHTTKEPSAQKDSVSGFSSMGDWAPTMQIDYTIGRAPFRVTARSSTGDLIPLDSGLDARPSSGLSDFFEDKKTRRGAIFTLPRYGVPSTYKWLDVKMA